MAAIFRIIDQWEAQRTKWLPTSEDKDFVASLMQPVTGPGKIAGWISPPSRGVDGHTFDYEYVRLS